MPALCLCSLGRFSYGIVKRSSGSNNFSAIARDGMFASVGDGFMNKNDATTTE